MKNVSGLASFLKARLTIGKGYISSSLKSEKPTHGSAIESSILEVVTKHQQLQELKSTQDSVKSFGGTNAHVVLDRLNNLEVRENAKKNRPGHYCLC